MSAHVNAPNMVLNKFGQRLLANGGRLAAMRTNATLLQDEWRQYDTAIGEAAEERLNGIAAIRNRGLIHQLNGLGVLESFWQTVSAMDPAQQSISGATAGTQDRPEYGTNIIPVPITHKEFEIELRHLLASRMKGEALDVTAARVAARQVAEKLEDTLFLGGDVTIGTNGIPGLTTHTDRGTYTITTAWDGVTNHVEVVNDVIGMIDIANQANYFGPFTLFVPGNFGTVLYKDYDTTTTTLALTVGDRILQIPTIQEIAICDRLTDDEVLLVQTTSDVIDLAVAEDIQTVEWEVDPMVTHFKVLAAIVPRVKSDYNGNSGIVHGS